MEQTVHNAEAYDFRQYDRIWQRVAPNLEPYLDMPETPEMTGMAEAMTAASAPSTQQESQLPGAAPNPCCMGTAAEEMLDILTGYIEEELSDRRSILALARQAPSWARQRLRDIAADQANSARRLMAAYYLIRGECYHPSVSMERIYTGRWCPALRERYHAAACNGLNYARSAEDSTDPCLRRLLQELSDLSYAHADALMQMLERSIQR
ncbi:MAG: ferritin-like domain-containing protein [Oscillibacter sp.]|nr:ferritin-like domain-containing protein [Oscillibacter sp.]